MIIISVLLILIMKYYEKICLQRLHMLRNFWAKIKLTFIVNTKVLIKLLTLKK